MSKIHRQELHTNEAGYYNINHNLNCNPIIRATYMNGRDAVEIETMNENWFRPTLLYEDLNNVKIYIPMAKFDGIIYAIA